MKRYLSFSGGGFNSHSFLAGMLSGALDSLEDAGRIRDVGLLTQSVGGFSANSGGSWFLSQLSYSKPFLDQFESVQSADSYNSKGYNGRIADIFQSVSSGSDSESGLDIVSSLVSNTQSPSTAKLIQSWFSMLARSGFSWRAFNQQITYKPFAMTSLMSSTPFSADRLGWASGKDFVVSAALQAKPTILDSIPAIAGQNKITAQAISEAVDPAAQTVPLSLVSVADGMGGSSSYRSTALLPVGKNAIKYSTNAWFGAPKPKQINLSSAIDASQLSVFDVTTASSSAVALLAAPTTYGGVFGASMASVLSPLVNQISYKLRDLSPPVTFKNDVMLMPSELSKGSSLKPQFRLLSSDVATRLADGAYVDNTSAAYMVKHIQSKQSIDDPFYLTVFSNSTSSPESGIVMQGASRSQPFTVTSDVAALFGNSDGNGDDSSVVTNTTLGQQSTPSPQVFALDAWDDIAPLWTYESGKIDLSMYRLSVETVDNEAFGVKAGQSGTVDVYVSRNPSSAPAPYQSSNLTAYAQNYDVFREAVGEGGGFEYLSESLGVVGNQIDPRGDDSVSEAIDDAGTASGFAMQQIKDVAPHELNVLRGSNRKRIVGTDADDMILHPRGKIVVRGGGGVDLHLMNHVDRSFSHKDKIAKSVIVDFDDDDMILLRGRQFGRQITFEHARTRHQMRRFQQSEADFVFFDRGARSGADPDLSSSLFRNANGSKPGWGDKGGLFIHFRNGFDLSLADLALF